MWVREIAWVDPVDAAERLADLPALALLHSAMPHPTLGRYSTCAADPFAVFEVIDGRAVLDGVALPGPPLVALRAELARMPIEPVAALPPFQGGAIGLLSYEFGWSLDRGPNHGGSSSGRTAWFGFYDTIVAFDHVERRCWVIASGWPAPSRASRRRRAGARLDGFVARLSRAVPRAGRPEPVPLSWTPAWTRDVYSGAVERVRAFIRAGDIYQANIAQRFTARLPDDVDTVALYRHLAAANPAPFAAYLRCGATTILSSSPERFLRTRGRSVETRPIKGTAPRAADPATDQALAQALLASDKDRAENVMIVDLLRNDLSRVCAPRSVAVSLLCGLESYAGLHHLVSVITGTLRDDADAFDLIAATFPGGSITGAPKLRAMEIIDAIEGPRGAYCGAIGAIGFDGDIDLNIAIRTVVVDGGTATVRAGGGITILSDPDTEYEETLTKARRIFAAFAVDPAPTSDAVA